MNNKHNNCGQDQDLILSYDVNFFDDNKFTHVVCSMSNSHNDMNLDKENGPYLSLSRQQSHFDLGFISVQFHTRKNIQNKPNQKMSNTRSQVGQSEWGL